MRPKYFTLAEMIRTDTELPNIPTFEQVDNLYALIVTVLDPLREAFKRPIKVNSGFRSVKVNEVIGGAKNSEHLMGFAADITAGDKELNKELFDLIIKLNLPYNQLIDERGYQWLHVSTSARPKRQILHL